MRLFRRKPVRREPTAPAPAPAGMKWHLARTTVPQGRRRQFWLQLWPQEAVVNEWGVGHVVLRKARPNFSKGAPIPQRAYGARYFREDRPDLIHELSLEILDEVAREQTMREVREELRRTVNG